ncbi:MAG: hypothetical protein ACFFD1_11350 [Candidatus Thorarchaeota archaeon]
MTLYHHQFLRELKDYIIELEETEYEILMLTDIPQISYLGIVIDNLEKGNKYSLPYFICSILVLSNKAEWAEKLESQSDMVNKLVNLFGIEQRSPALQNLNNINLGILLFTIKEILRTDQNEVLSPRLEQEMKNLVSQRIKKILTKYKIESPKDLKKRLDPIEDVLFEQIDMVIQIYEHFLFSNLKSESTNP